MYVNINSVEAKKRNNAREVIEICLETVKNTSFALFFFRSLPKKEYSSFSEQKVQRERQKKILECTFEICLKIFPSIWRRFTYWNRTVLCLAFNHIYIVGNRDKESNKCVYNRLTGWLKVQCAWKQCEWFLVRHLCRRKRIFFSSTLFFAPNFISLALKHKFR